MLQILDLFIQRLDACRGAAVRDIDLFAAAGTFGFFRFTAFRLLIDRLGHQYLALFAGGAEDVADAGYSVTGTIMVMLVDIMLSLSLDVAAQGIGSGR